MDEITKIFLVLLEEKSKEFSANKSSETLQNLIMLSEMTFSEQCKKQHSRNEAIQVDRYCQRLELVKAELQEEYKRLNPDGIPPY
jgi:hypothetical protein